jgi:hypothetical protein
MSLDLSLSDFIPRSQLVTKMTRVEKPRFPVIDAHNHLAEPFGGGWDRRPVSELLDLLDTADVRVYVDLDGGWGEDILNRHLDHFKNAAPERFIVFGGVDWSQWSEHGDHFGEWAAKRLREQVARGAQGLKIWKPFGLHVRDHNEALVAVDDPRLHAHPDWQFPSPPYPSFMTILNGLATLVANHPQTTFIGAHVACYAENLGWVSELLDRCPNLYIDFSARLGEIGRQPYSARRFFIQYADRILFGTDASPSLEDYCLYYRFLETDDEYFNYNVSPVPQQGRWYVYGLYLPDDVLKKIYYDNAARILPVNST